MRPDCAFSDVRNGDTTFEKQIYHLRSLLERSARELEAAGKPDEALSRYLAALQIARHLRQGTGTWLWGEANFVEEWIYRDLTAWAAQPGQSRERILAAGKQLDELEAERPYSIEAIQADYLRLREIVLGGPAAIASSGVDEWKASQAIAWSLLPWERDRALRLLNYCTFSDSQYLYDVRWLPAADVPVGDGLRAVYRDPTVYGDSESRWLRTTFLLSPFYSLHSSAWLGMNSAKLETRRRATHVIMAIEAWKLDHHGELPHRLDELVDDYLSRLPNDPFSGVPFRYVPKGMPAPPALSPHDAGEWPAGEIPRKAFIWSAGEHVRIGLPPVDEMPAAIAAGMPLKQGDADIIDDQGHWRRPESEYDVWLSGQWFEIP